MSDGYDSEITSETEELYRDFELASTPVVLEMLYGAVVKVRDNIETIEACVLELRTREREKIKEN